MNREPKIHFAWLARDKYAALWEERDIYAVDSKDSDYGEWDIIVLLERNNEAKDNEANSGFTGRMALLCVTAGRYEKDCNGHFQGEIRLFAVSIKFTSFETGEGSLVFLTRIGNVLFDDLSLPENEVKRMLQQFYDEEFA
uniref:Uncharacterized protein n=1 Tax=Candidatus Kentrum sp. FM TaxID=2126340 RepID=A0A450S6C3_9GAMM|nr:MAG: hypothetical protein BECKFM1743A_GA0114220_1004713 [Candidatus Kentron sp. FM]VFJ47845.1 MAG: hypothetical protein BECKFM1743C_GA0114222_100518 [Candidatus Kentron sp. FM]VFK07859.1 MAG: hypothetical protein BECKFM1743B_GA0114221_1005212 [Candidatus Kentron sp. FM]